MKTLINRARPAEVLLIDDNENDVELTRIGFEKSKFMVKLHHAENGEECMAFLRRQGKFAHTTKPDLILLDLNMPRMGGLEVLKEIARDEGLASIPVVVLTTSEADADILAAYRLRCNSYIVKPVDFDKFAEVIRGIGNYWFTLVVVPSTLNQAGK